VREERLKTIVVTSPSTGDGKSSTVANLAICMAHAGRRTLIVDADLRRPIQHEIFSLPQHAGLSSVLSGDASLEDSIFPTHINGLDLLPSGALPSRPSESLNSERFASILATLAQHYDYVLLDSPPVLAVADARILSAMSDATLLVLRWNSSTRHASLSARESLWSVGAKILGFVVNDITKTTNGYYESYYPPRTPGLGNRSNGNGAMRLEKNGNGKVYENGKTIGNRENIADKRDPMLPGPGTRA
jgi:polysaccharide biosynthesis transport protein